MLLVEDSAVDAALVKGLLRHRGNQQFAVSEVTTLAEALHCLNQTEIDVVVLDLTLPDSTGLETLRRMVARSTRVPIVVLTGADEAIGIEAMREGAQDYIPKGQLQGPLLARSVRYAMERHRASQALRESQESRTRSSPKILTGSSRVGIPQQRDCLDTLPRRSWENPCSSFFRPIE